MNRRHFLTSSLAASGWALHAETASHLGMSSLLETQPVASRERYALRRYQLQMGPQTALAEHFFANAWMPAMTRLKLGPVGVFKLDVGPETPTYYTLVPGASAEALASVDSQLAQDETFLKVAEPFWSAPAASPPFQRVETTLLLAFEGWPKLLPPAAGVAAKRIFQLRTYESPTYAAHVRKVEMFNQGEFGIFQRTGLHPVFFGETIFGSRMPSLTYMLTFADMRELEANWAVFVADPAWKKLSSDPRYAYEAIVSNITNLILSPLPCSQL